MTAWSMPNGSGEANVILDGQRGGFIGSVGGEGEALQIGRKEVDVGVHEGTGGDGPRPAHSGGPACCLFLMQFPHAPEIAVGWDVYCGPERSSPFILSGNRRWREIFPLILRSMSCVPAICRV